MEKPTQEIKKPDDEKSREIIEEPKLAEKATILSNEEAKGIMRTKEFENFFDRTSRIIERAIDTDTNILRDYFTEDNDDAAHTMHKTDKMQHQFTFMENAFRKRAVSSIDWSPKEPELLLCSYSKSSEWKHSEADGLIDIFSLALRSRPEMQLTSQYEITKAMFNPFKPNEVLAATFSGNIL